LKSLFVAVVALWPVMGQAQEHPMLEAFGALPMVTEGPVVLRYGAPEAMRDLLPNFPRSQAAFTAIARSLPEAISGHAAVLAENGAQHGIDVFAMRQVAMMQAAGGTAMVLDLAPGQGAVLSRVLPDAFGHTQAREGWTRAGEGTFFSGGAAGLSHVRLDGDRMVQATDERFFASRGAVPDGVRELVAALDAATPPQAVPVQVALFLNLPDAEGLPVGALLVADITSGDRDGVVIIGDPSGPDDIASFLQSAHGMVAPDEMDILLIGGLIAAYEFAPRDPDQPPWRNVLSARVAASLADASFWRSTGEVE